jgi:signal transduction histidine kinase/CheY-like chemotaxis protein
MTWRDNRRQPPARQSGPPQIRAEWIGFGLLVIAAALLLGLNSARPSLAPALIVAALVVGALAALFGARIEIAAKQRENGTLAAANRELTGRIATAEDREWDLRDREARLALVTSARDRAEAASAAKSRFLATVTHEIRTPLSGMLGLADVLLDTDLSDEQRTFARGIRSSGEMLLGLTGDLLDLARIEAGRLDLAPQPTSLEAMAHEIAELLAPRAHAKGIDVAAYVAPEVPAEVMVDGPRLRQVLINLAGNAIKFTGEGGVTILVEAGEEGRLDFAVTDTGPGVDPATAERIFDEFEQAARADAGEGTGLGLAIARRIVRAMGGDIAVEPRPGVGSQFRFGLALPPATAAAVGGRPAASRRLLLLAPEDDGGRLLLRMLADDGSAGRMTASPVQAAALAGASVAAGTPYDALLVDARIADPVAALGQIRAAAGAPLPAAVLIEPAHRRQLDSLREAGFDAYLVRPFRRSSVSKVVEALTAPRAGFFVDPSDARPPVLPRRSGRRLKVLLVEDNEISALLMRAVLERLGHAVAEAADGAGGIALATGAEAPFDLILADLQLPEADGYQLARTIRGHERDARLPRAAMMAVTASADAAVRAAAVQAGFDDVLEKPVTPEALRRVLADRSLTAAA